MIEVDVRLPVEWEAAPFLCSFPCAVFEEQDNLKPVL